MVTHNKNLIKKIRIKKFRKLKDIDIDIAERITVIAGHNGIGKSTILGLIANASELRGYQSYFNKVFQSKFNEIFHLDSNHDYTKNSDEKYSVIIDYLYKNTDVYKMCTVSQNVDRLRIVPRNSNSAGKLIGSQVLDIGADAKVPIPTLYIGMSRVIPIGESKEEHYSLTHSNIDEQDIHDLNLWFKEIIGDEELEDDKVSKQDLKYSTKRSLGPSFKDYSYKSVSLGQDSLSTILTAILSFKKLKRELGKDYHGGILVIDEIDACLHPSAQSNLIRVIDQCSKSLKLQIVCTTHSLTVIQEILGKQITTNQNPKDDRLYYNVVYVQDTAKPSVMDNPSYLKIKNDMFLRFNLYQDNKHDVKIYFEDEEAIFFFDNIKKNTEQIDTEGLRFDKICAQISCDTLLKLPNKDSYFKSVLILLDNDVLNSQIYREIISENENLCVLPGTGSPEETIHQYLLELVKNTDHPYWKDNQGIITVQAIRDRTLKTIKDLLKRDSEKRKREIYKEWFKEFKLVFEQTKIITYWMNDNSEKIQEFITSFNQAIKYLRTHQIKNDK
ncbi:AAA family ATPase [Pseudobacillus badius]|nr:AAA family ATPase [Bacillus badius]